MSGYAKFTILREGDCPICRVEVKWLTRINESGWPAFEDISRLDFDSERGGISKDELMTKIHGITLEWKVISGVEVFRRSYNAVGLGWMMALNKWPVLNCVADYFYTIFARHRLGLDRVLLCSPKTNCWAPALLRVS
ncbi:MAG: DUF393 domain-containing protein [Pseudomonadota bacterium]